MSLLYVDPKSEGKLYQAGISEILKILRSEKIYMLILSAREFQPKISDLPATAQQTLSGVHIYYLPMRDILQISKEDLQKVDEISNLAAFFISRGKNVLSTCRAGRNRSGLISGHILKKLTDASGNEIVDHIRMHRNPLALSNPTFSSIIKNL